MDRLLTPEDQELVALRLTPPAKRAAQLRAMDNAEFLVTSIHHWHSALNVPQNNVHAETLFNQHAPELLRRLWAASMDDMEFPSTCPLLGCNAPLPR